MVVLDYTDSPVSGGIRPIPRIFSLPPPPVPSRRDGKGGGGREKIRGIGLIPPLKGLSV